MTETKVDRGRNPARAALTTEEVAVFLEREFPQLVDDAGGLSVVDSSADHATMRLDVGNRHLRPGGTVSGPTQFFLADVCAFVAVLVAVGPVALAVTTSATINFLKKPAPTALLATARLLKRGKRLVVVDCLLQSEGDDEPVAHAVLTYALPLK